MAVPDWNLSGVLPPFLYSPVDASSISPYICTTVELCERFATSIERVSILRGYLKMRAQMRAHGLTKGFQWVNGSFVEHVEATARRAPRDVDVVTFFDGLTEQQQMDFLNAVPALAAPDSAKAEFGVDHYFVDLGCEPALLVEQARYWAGLFSHTRDSLWKGMLQIDLDTPTEDAEATTLLLTIESEG